MTHHKYGIEVYSDHAVIHGRLSSDILILLIKLCKKEGFTHMTSSEDGKGFKLVRNGK